jgi:hypothetical protein
MCLKADPPAHMFAILENGKIVYKDCHETCSECIGEL